jgi:hypothetical protein
MKFFHVLNHLEENGYIFFLSFTLITALLPVVRFSPRIYIFKKKI